MVFRNVKPGDVVADSAAFHNATLAAIRKTSSVPPGDVGGYAAPPGGVLVSVRNTTGAATVDPFSVVGLDALTYDPNDAAADDFPELVFDVTTWSPGQRWGVLQSGFSTEDEVLSDACALAGITWARVDLTASIGLDIAGPKTGDHVLQHGWPGAELLLPPAETGERLVATWLSPPLQITLAKSTGEITPGVGENVDLYTDAGVDANVSADCNFQWGTSGESIAATDNELFLIPDLTAENRWRIIGRECDE